MRIKLLSVTIVTGCIVFMILSDGNTLLSNIQPPELVVKGHWGNKDNEFGIVLPEQGEPPGPQSFCIDKKGNIYVSDNVNLRFKKYDSEGKLLAIKSFEDIFDDVEDITTGNAEFIYALASKKPYSDIIIAVMDTELTVRKECAIGKLLGIKQYGGLTLTADATDNLYIEGLPKGLIKVSNLHKVEIIAGSLAVGYGGIVKIAAATDTTQKYFPEKLQISQEKLNNDKILKIQYRGPMVTSFYSIDSLGRIYFLSGTYEERNRGILSIYSSSGFLLDTISVKIDFIHYSSGSHYGKVGMDNNYYQVQSDTSGFYIYRYKISDK